MKYEIKKEKQALSKRISGTIELLTLVGILCSLFLIMYATKTPKEPKEENEELVYVFKETELYDILDFDEIEAQVSKEERSQ